MTGDEQVVFGDIHFERRPYGPWVAFTANVLFAVGASTRWASDGITVSALTTGRIRTMRYFGDEQSAGIRGAFEPPSASMPTSPLLHRVGGRSTSRTAMRPSRTSPASAAVLPGTGSTPRQPLGCGRSRWTPSAP